MSNHLRLWLPENRKLSLSFCFSNNVFEDAVPTDYLPLYTFAYTLFAVQNAVLK